MTHMTPPNLLVIAESERGELKLVTLAAVGCARQVAEATGGRFDILVIGAPVQAAVDALQGYGAANIFVAEAKELAVPTADNFAHVIVDVARTHGITMLTAAASTFSKDILPRVAAILDAGMLSDVTAVVPVGDDYTFDRVMYAGNVIATVTLDGPVKVFTIRASAFSAPEKTGGHSPVVPIAVDPASLPNRIESHDRVATPSGRPDATEARVVVSGGRAIKNAADFERLVGGLADVLGAAVGSSRALVDAGIVPNTLQIGQTGKAVAPELYIGLGISGAIQHLAGMKDSKVIVAINQDSEAPIFEIADYGLVGDIYAVVPELIGKLKPS